MARYEAGETLASIARTYDCSPPAISYVVSRSRGQRPTAPEAASSGAEAQLVKAAASEAAEASIVASIKTPAAEVAPPTGAQAPAEEPVESPTLPSQRPPSENVASPPRPEPLGAGQGQDEAPRYANGGAREGGERPLRQGESPIRPAIAPVMPQRPVAQHQVAQQQGGDQRRTLHRMPIMATAETTARRCDRLPRHANILSTASRRLGMNPKTCRVVAAMVPRSTASFAPGSMAISLPSSLRLTPPWHKTRSRAGRHCARRPTGCCAQARGPVSNSSGSKRERRCRRATTADVTSQPGGIADPSFSVLVVTGMPRRGNRLGRATLPR
jgi:transposase-like protein